MQDPPSAPSRPSSAMDMAIPMGIDEADKAHTTDCSTMGVSLMASASQGAHAETYQVQSLAMGFSMGSQKAGVQENPGELRKPTRAFQNACSEQKYQSPHVPAV